jgi:hypothetical protein
LWAVGKAVAFNFFLAGNFLRTVVVAAVCFLSIL